MHAFIDLIESDPVATEKRELFVLHLESLSNNLDHVILPGVQGAPPLILMSPKRDADRVSHVSANAP